MKNQPELELLIEITKLLKKYGSATFENLAQSISSPVFSDSLIALLSETAKKARTIESRKTSSHIKTQNKKNFRSTLVELQNTEPDKSEVLVQFYDNLIAKSILPTMQDIRNFTVSAGLPLTKASSRDRAIVPLVKNLMILSTEEVNEKINLLKLRSNRDNFSKDSTNKDNRSLEGWSEIILNKDKRMK